MNLHADLKRHEQEPSNVGAAAAQHYLDDLQRKSVAGQLAYIKRKQIQRRLRMKKVPVHLHVAAPCLHAPGQVGCKDNSIFRAPHWMAVQ